MLCVIGCSHLRRLSIFHVPKHAVEHCKLFWWQPMHARLGIFLCHIRAKGMDSFLQGTLLDEILGPPSEMYGFEH